MDDLLDYIGTEEKLGKPVCNDLREGKLTYPLISILDKLTEAEKEKVKNLIRDLNPSDEAINEVKNIVLSKEGDINTINKAKYFVEEAIKELESFPRNEYIVELEDLAKYIIERDY